MIDVALLRTFLAVYRAGSLTAAAGTLGMAQPTVTAHVKSLEDRLGRQLFERLPRGVRPTDLAHAVARQIGPAMDELSTIATGLLDHRDPLAMPVRLAGPGEFLEVLALPALADAVADGLAVRVTTTLADEALAGLTEGRFDLAISPVRPRVRGVLATPLTDEEFVLVAAPTWVERLGPPSNSAALAGRLTRAPLLSYAEDLPILRRYWRVVFGRKLVGRAALVVPDLRALRTAALAGMGVTVLPRYLCAAELASGSLVALLEPELPPINTLYLATVGTPRDPRLVAVRRHLLDTAKQW